ncbi:hypothetical protein AAG906_005548 [Vitis piasezkii]
MAMATLSRRLHRLLLSNPQTCQFSIPFSTYLSSHESSDSSSDSDSVSDSDKLTVDPIADSPPTDTTQNRMVVDRPLENGLDVGIYKAGQTPLQKRLRSGRMVTLFSWHRVTVYPENLGNIVMKHVSPGSILYLEGNLETKIFTDPVTGLVRRIREVAIRRNGRLVFLGKGGDGDQASNVELKGAGYY